MSNFTELYDYALTGDNIQVWPTEESDMITIEAAAFFAWLDVKCYIIESDSVGNVALYQNADGEPIWETWNEWWADARVISQPGKFDGKRDLLDQLLCDYLNDPVNVRYADCRTVADLPTEFLTSAEKAGKN